MRILFVDGSHRKGNTDICIEKCISHISKDHQVRILPLRDIEIKLPDGCEESANSGICPHITDEFSIQIEPTIRDYDVYVIATPVWSDGMTPLTKIFIDRIVSWCHADRMYLKGKKLALITHGMADENSWSGVINWIKGICTWEGSIFGGSLCFKSNAQIGTIKMNESNLEEFIKSLLSPSK